jgi:hypothetical protein
MGLGTPRIGLERPGLDRERPDAVILHVSVLEAHVAEDGEIEELADDMTVHFVPSYLILGANFFDDYAKAQRAMVRVIPGLEDRYGLNDLRIPVSPDPDPKWSVQRGVLETVATLDLLDRFKDHNPDVFKTEVQRQIPAVARRG